jgi:hypothetical protein
MQGDVGHTSWLRNCSVHHTYNRAIAIHGTSRVTLRHNVAYHVMGHAYFLEDGIEVGG